MDIFLFNSLQFTLMIQVSVFAFRAKQLLMRVAVESNTLCLMGITVELWERIGFDKVKDRLVGDTSFLGHIK